MVIERPAKETEQKPPLFFEATIKGVKLTEEENNDFRYEWYGLEEQDVGTSWTDYYLEADIQLTDAPQNKGLHIQKLTVRSQNTPLDFEDLKPENTVLIRIENVSKDFTDNSTELVIWSGITIQKKPINAVST